MKISMQFGGTYTEHKEFFDALAKAMQSQGHKVGIISGDREKDPYTKKDKKAEILAALGFKPDFVYLWGEYETIGNGSMWKAQRLIENEINMHFDDDGTELKKYTDTWIVKVMNSGQKEKF